MTGISNTREETRGATSQAVFARHFLLQEVVTTGERFAVWRGTDQRSGETVALKFFPKNLFSTSVDVLTVREILTPVRNFRDPRVIAAHQVATDSDYAAVITPWVNGMTLTQLRRARPHECFEVAAIDSWMRTLTDLLASVHAHGLVHGALHPDNVFVREDGELSVVGFGIDAWLHFTSRKIFGPAKHDPREPYSSPSVLRGEPLRIADDVLAFGALVYELLAGSPPLGPGRWRKQRRSLPIARMRRRNGCPDGTISAAWENVVQACLATEETSRPPDFGSIRLQLGFDLPVFFPIHPKTSSPSTLAAPSPGITAERSPPVIATPDAPDKSGEHATGHASSRDIAPPFSGTNLQSKVEPAPKAQPTSAALPSPTVPFGAPKLDSPLANGQSIVPEPRPPRAAELESLVSAAVQRVQAEKPVPPPPVSIQESRPAPAPLFSSTGPIKQTEPASPTEPARTAATPMAIPPVAATLETPCASPPPTSSTAPAVPANSPPAFSSDAGLASPEKFTTAHAPAPDVAATSSHVATSLPPWKSLGPENEPAAAKNGAANASLDPLLKPLVRPQELAPPAPAVATDPSAASAAVPAAAKALGDSAAAPHDVASRSSSIPPDTAVHSIPVPVETSPLLPPRPPIRYNPTDEQPLAKSKPGSISHAHHGRWGTRALVALIICTLLTAIAVGGLWGWQVYEARREFLALQQEVLVFPLNASELERAKFEERLVAARSRLNSQQWQSLRDTWATRKSTRIGSETSATLSQPPPAR